MLKLAPKRHEASLDHYVGPRKPEAPDTAKAGAPKGTK